MYTYVYIYIYIYIYTHIHVYIHIYIYITEFSRKIGLPKSVLIISIRESNKLRVPNPISKYIHVCVEPLVNPSCFLKKCMHARIQSPRV